MMERLKQLLQKRSRKNTPQPPQRPAIENPYRRFYSQDRSFDDLVRRAKQSVPDEKKCEQ